MKCVYNLRIDRLENSDEYKITWENTSTYDRDSFIRSASKILEYLPDLPGDLWQYSLEHRLKIGRELKAFLDGDNGYMDKALAEAFDLGEPLLINLSTGEQCCYWPFELLAKDSIFLLPRHIHLVHRLSDRGMKKKILPQKRRLKILFMCCAPRETHLKLDLHREEERIFNETDRLPIDIDVEDSGTLDGLREKLEEKRFDVIHLSVHAIITQSGETALIMEDETGSPVWVAPDKLWGKALKTHPPRLLFLSSWRRWQNSPDQAAGSFARTLVKSYPVPGVLSWSHPVNENRANLAESYFYRELARGESILNAVQKTRDELSENVTVEQGEENETECIWPQLQLFCDGTLLNEIVAKEQGKQPNDKMETNLEITNLPDVKKGFIGRRRQMQRGTKMIRGQNAAHIGMLILGPAKLGKTSFAAKLLARFKNFQPIIIRGKLDELSLVNALKVAFLQNHDKHRNWLNRGSKGIRDKLPELCVSSFRDHHYLILLDDFHVNLKDWEREVPGPVIQEAASLLSVLLKNLPFCCQQSKLIITSRFGFSLDAEGADLVKKRLEIIWLTSFLGPEQRKLQRELAQRHNCPVSSELIRMTALGRGNPQLMDDIVRFLKSRKDIEDQELRNEVIELRETFSRQYRLVQLAKTNKELESFLRWLSIFRMPVPRGDVPELAGSLGFKGIGELLERGMELGLIEYTPDQETCMLTPLLREDLLPMGLKARRYHESALSYYQSLVDQKSPIELVELEECIYHALRCGQVQIVPGLGTYLVKQLRDNCFQLHEAKGKGLWIISELRKKRVLMAFPNIAFLFNEIAVTLSRLNEFEEALKHYKNAYTIIRTMNDATQETIAQSLNNLGTVWRNLGNDKMAAFFFKKALGFIQKAKDGDSLKLAIIKNNLGTILRKKGKYREALTQLEEAREMLAAVDEVDAKKHYSITLNNMGVVLEDLEEYGQAEENFRLAYNIDCNLYPAPHPCLATDLNNLGSLWASQGKFERATGYYLKAFRLLYDFYGSFHLEVATTLSNLGDAYYHLGEKEKAKEHYERAYKIFAKISPNHLHARELEERIEEARKVLS